MTQPHFVATEENAPAIAQICTRLDGLPLALELAAARCKFLTPQILLERLEGTASGSPLPTLSSGPRDAPPRQRTLRASIEWSYNLLDEADRTLLVRLAVFRGGTSLEAIEAVCAEGLSKDIFEGLASLVDKSLLQQKEIPNGELRFVMLEMIRAYGRERLEASSELEIMHRLHATYFVAMTERAEPELRLTRYDDWCERFELDWDNIRAALEWTVRGGDVTLGVRLAGALGLFWYGKGHHVEGTRWTRELLERYREAPTSYHARFLISAGHMAWMHDLEIAQRLLREAFKISRELDDKLQMAWALVFLGYTMQQEPEAAQVFAERALALFCELNHQPGIAQTFNVIGEIARIHGDDSRARSAYEECLAICRKTGEARRICYMLNNLAYIAQHEGDHDRALSLVRQSLRLALDRKDRYDTAWALQLLAGSMGTLGQLRSAVRLLGASEAAWEQIGSLQQPTDRPEGERISAELRARLDETAFQALWEEGRKMTLDQAATYALRNQA
jgi:tetratricopeptide (TPR) repeat protein